MVLVRWNPWVEFAALQREATGALMPPLDAYRTDSGLAVSMELAGMAPQDVEVSVADGRLTVSGERRVDDKVDKASWVRRERSVGRFERTFTLPRDTDPDKITASFENGVLSLEIPHPAERQPRKITIGAAGSANGHQSVVDEELAATAK